MRDRLGTRGRPRGRRLRRRRRGRARRRRGVGHVRGRVRGGRPLPARDDVDARPRAQVPGGVAVRPRRDGCRRRARPTSRSGLPEHLGEREVLELADGARGARAEHGVTICGGDLTRADELFVAVTVVGYADERGATRHARRRRPGRPASASPARWAARAPACSCWSAKPAGIDAGDRERGCSTATCARGRCWRPAARWQRRACSAMIDVSDGIASDLERLCERSGVAHRGASSTRCRWTRASPRSRRGRASTRSSSRPAAGEDYELLFTAPAGRARGGRAGGRRRAARR